MSSDHTDICKRVGCGQEIEQTGVGRPREFCSVECRRKAWFSVKAPVTLRQVLALADEDVLDASQIGVVLARFEASRRRLVGPSTVK